MISRYLFALLLICIVSSASGQVDDDFNLETSREIHRSFDYQIGYWTAGGDLTRYVYSNMTEFWRHSLIRRTGEVKPLNIFYRNDVANFITNSALGKLTLNEYVNKSPTNGMIVLHKGNIVFESWPKMVENDHHSYFSVSKTFVSAIIGILEDRNEINVNNYISFYLDELHGTSWEKIKIIDILDMASGINCRESEENSYTDPEACFYQFFESIGFPYADKALESPLDFFKQMSSYRPAGEAFDYNGINTSILTFLIERVTNKSYVDLLEKEIWQKMGAESDGYIAISPYGYPASLGGMSSKLRDLGRYGLLYTPSGREDPNPVISAAYLDKIQNKGRPDLYKNSNAKALNNEIPRHNTYQWDKVMHDGDFYKSGFGGQGLYISPKRDLVIAFFGSQDDDGQTNELHHISRQLAISNLFN